MRNVASNELASSNICESLLGGSLQDVRVMGPAEHDEMELDSELGGSGPASASSAAATVGLTPKP